MGLYQKHILPKITDCACQQKPARYQRKKIVPHARGRVLELGIGSGLNLPFYDLDQVTHIWGIEPSAEMLEMATSRAHAVQVEIEFFQTGAEQIPLEAGAVDTIVTTYTLCTIPDLNTAFQEMRRVLNPNGQILFCEHGKAPDAAVRRWQNFVQPVWKICGGGCHLNRDIPALLEGGGFSIQQMDTMYIPGWKPASFNYWGRAIL